MRERDVAEGYERWLSGRDATSLYVRWYLRHRPPREADRMWREIGVGSFERVLDVGCAGGFYLVDAYERGHGRSLLAGVDITSQLIDEAGARLAPLMRSTTIRLAVASATALPFDDSEMDVVFSNGMVKYLGPEQFEAFVAEAKRVLRPGGRLYVDEFAQRVGLRGRLWRDHYGIPTQNLCPGDVRADVLRRQGFEGVRAFANRGIRRIPFTMEGAVGTRP